MENYIFYVDHSTVKHKKIRNMFLLEEEVLHLNYQELLRQ